MAGTSLALGLSSPGSRQRHRQSPGLQPAGGRANSLHPHSALPVTLRGNYRPLRKKALPICNSHRRKSFWHCCERSFRQKFCQQYCHALANAGVICAESNPKHGSQINYTETRQSGQRAAERARETADHQLESWDAGVLRRVSHCSLNPFFLSLGKHKGILPCKRMFHEQLLLTI